MGQLHLLTIPTPHSVGRSELTRGESQKLMKAKKLWPSKTLPVKATRKTLSPPCHAFNPPEPQPALGIQNDD